MEETKHQKFEEVWAHELRYMVNNLAEEARRGNVNYSELCRQFNQEATAKSSAADNMPRSTTYSGTDHGSTSKNGNKSDSDSLAAALAKNRGLKNELRTAHNTVSRLRDEKYRMARRIEVLEKKNAKLAEREEKMRALMEE